MEETTNRTSGDGADTSGGRFDRAKGFVNEKYSAASDAVRDGYNTVRERVDDVDTGQLLDNARGYVRSHPGKALLISVGVGFLLGLLLRSDDSED
jgi:ElaB/YqjD/DUF883 family membrane-anchored ribosome-binding protein